MDGNGDPSCSGCGVHIPEAPLPLCRGVAALWGTQVHAGRFESEVSLPRVAVLNGGGAT